MSMLQPGVEHMMGDDVMMTTMQVHINFLQTLKEFLGTSFTATPALDLNAIFGPVDSQSGN